MDLVPFLALAAAAGLVLVVLLGKTMFKHERPLVVLAAGELLVTSDGEVVVDETLPMSRALLVAPERYVSVHFAVDDCAPPPCAGSGEPEELEWELFIKKCHDHYSSGHNHHGHAEEELKLKISWRVNGARTIKWMVTKSPH